MTFLNSPLDEKTVSSLKVGDVVYINGSVITARDEAHIRALKYLEEGKKVPDCFNGATLYHCGPIMAKSEGEWNIVAAGPTTSARMNSLESEMIKKFKIRAIIGKGGMSDEVAKTMSKEKCVYLAATGGAAVTLAEGLSVAGVEWEDLGMPEAVWKFNAKKFGPFVVAIDCKGNNLYKQVKESLKK